MRRVCIYCEHELVITGRGGVCPVCSAPFLASLGIQPPTPRGQELVELHEKREAYRRRNNERKEAA